MDIKILGAPCDGCKTLYGNVLLAVSELDIEAKIEAIEDIMEILREYEAVDPPCLIIDKKIVSSGKSLSKEDIKQLLTKQMRMPDNPPSEDCANMRLLKNRINEMKAKDSNQHSESTS